MPFTLFKTKYSVIFFGLLSLACQLLFAGQTAGDNNYPGGNQAQNSVAPTTNQRIL